MSLRYFKKVIKSLVLSGLWLVSGCKDRKDNPPVIDDLAIALQTIKHQIEGSAKIKNSSYNAVVDSSQRKTEVTQTQFLDFDEKLQCLKPGGEIQVTLTTKKTGLKEDYIVKIIDANFVSLKQIGAKYFPVVYKVRTICR